MKTYLECIPCFFRQTLEASRLAGASEKDQKKILDDVARLVPKFSLDLSPPEMARIIHARIKRTTRKEDPYLQIKKKSNSIALKAYPALKRKVERSKDRLCAALRLSIEGNIIDYGVKNSLNVEKEMRRILRGKHAQEGTVKSKHFDIDLFKKKLRTSDNILYLADNAGEVVFDRVLIEEIKRRYPAKRIIYAVKEKPAINDALIDDAIQCGVNVCCDLISSGSDAPGAVPALCSKKFLSLFGKADIVISKGQGNFESLSGARRPVFFLFMAKCPVVAREIGCDLKEKILLYRKGSKK